MKETRPILWAWLAVVACGLWLRLDGVASMPLYGDEYHTLLLIQEDPATILTQYDAWGSHIALPLIQQASRAVLGDHVVTLRLVAIVPGILLLLLLWPLGRQLVGSGPAWIGTALLALSPMAVYYTRFARTYALSMLLALLLVDAVRRATAEGSRGRHWIPVVLWSALLPYVHLSALGLVAAVALAGAVQGWRVRRAPVGALQPLLAVGVGLALCTALYLPARDTLMEYLTRIEGDADVGHIGWLDVPTVLFGGRMAGIVLTPLALIALIAMGAPGRRAAQAHLLWAAIGGPLLFLLLFRPTGMGYAWARYLHTSLPFLLLGVGWLVVQSLGASRERIALILGLVLALGLHLLGPRSPLHTPNGAFDNTYQSLYRLKAFDQPFPRTPEFYTTVADDPEVDAIIVWPPLNSRTALLYRNYQLQHGKRNYVGRMPEPGDEHLVSGPYVDVWDRKLPEKTDADYLVVHHDVAREVDAYWKWVFEAGLHDPRDEGFMERHRDHRNPPRPVGYTTLQPLERWFGKPVFQDRFVRVFDLR